MRAVSFAQACVCEFAGNVVAAAVALGDVDNDGVRDRIKSACASAELMRLRRETSWWWAISLEPWPSLKGYSRPSHGACATTSDRYGHYECSGVHLLAAHRARDRSPASQLAMCATLVECVPCTAAFFPHPHSVRICRTLS